MQTLVEQVNRPVETTKKCPFCAELIQLDAIKCRYCGEFLNRSISFHVVPQPTTSSSGKWYQSHIAVIVAIVTLGPLALPLVWSNPRYTRVVKAVITVGVIALTSLLCWACWALTRNLFEQIKNLGM